MSPHRVTHPYTVLSELRYKYNGPRNRVHGFSIRTRSLSLLLVPFVVRPSGYECYSCYGSSGSQMINLTTNGFQSSKTIAVSILTTNLCFGYLVDHPPNALELDCVVVTINFLHIQVSLSMRVGLSLSWSTMTKIRTRYSYARLVIDDNIWMQKVFSRFVNVADSGRTSRVEGTAHQHSTCATRITV